MVGGNWHHGELAVEQMLFLRPFAGPPNMKPPCPASGWPVPAAIPAAAFRVRPAGTRPKRILKVEGQAMRADRRACISSKPLLETPFHPRTSALQHAEFLGPLGRLHDGARLSTTRRWNIPPSATQPRSMTLPDGEIPHHRARCGGLPQPPDGPQCGQAVGGRRALHRLVRRRGQDPR